MKITFYSKNNKIEPKLREYTEKKMSVLERHLDHGIMDTRIELEENTAEHGGDKFRAEATVNLAKGLLRAEANAKSFQEAVDLMMPKLKKQLEKYKGKKRGVRQ